MYGCCKPYSENPDNEVQNKLQPGEFYSIEGKDASQVSSESNSLYILP